MIHLVRPTTKEGKIAQYDVIHRRLYLFKVPWVVNIKLFSRNEVFCLKFENFDKLQLPYSSIFFAEILHTFPTYQWLQKDVGFFLFCLDLELFAKVKRHLVSRHLFFTFLLIIQDLSKIKKIPDTLLQTLLSRKCVENFSKKN